MAELRIDMQSPAVQEAIQSALLAQLSEDAREAMIADALKHLVTQPKGSYGSSLSSPLEEAFRQAVGNFARGVVQEMMTTNPEWQERIRDKVVETFEALMTRERFGLHSC